MFSEFIYLPNAQNIEKLWDQEETWLTLNSRDNKETKPLSITLSMSMRRSIVSESEIAKLLYGFILFIPLYSFPFSPSSSLTFLPRLFFLPFTHSHNVLNMPNFCIWKSQDPCSILLFSLPPCLF